MQRVLASGFLFHAGRNFEVLGTPQLDRDRFELALSRMFGSTEPPEHCPLDSVAISFWSNDEWGAAPDAANFPNTLSKQYSVTMEFVPSSCESFKVRGSLIFYVKYSAENSSMSKGEDYEIVGIADYTWANKSAATESDAFSEVIAAYLFEGLPHAKLLENEMRGTDQVTFVMDATDSWCDGEGLHDLPFRWNIDGADLWSDWTQTIQSSFEFEEPGEHVVILEVRNKVGWTARAEANFEIFAQYPANLEQLLESFAYSHEARDVGLLVSCLDPDFTFNLLPQDIQDYELPSDQFDYGTYLGATISLLRETFGVGRPPLVLNIDFWWRDPSAELEGVVSTNIYARRLDAEALNVAGRVSFVAGPKSVDLPGGESREVWRFEELTDETSTVGFGSGNISWGGMLATYR